MRLSRYFLPILKENPREAEIVSHRLMLRAGMIRQQGQGSFTMLPLGKRVLDKVCKIVREPLEAFPQHGRLLAVSRGEGDLGATFWESEVEQVTE